MIEEGSEKTPLKKDPLLPDLPKYEIQLGFPTIPVCPGLRGVKLSV